MLGRGFSSVVPSSFSKYVSCFCLFFSWFFFVEEYFYEYKWCYYCTEVYICVNLYRRFPLLNHHKISLHADPNALNLAS